MLNCDFKATLYIFYEQIYSNLCLNKTVVDDNDVCYSDNIDNISQNNGKIALFVVAKLLYNWKCLSVYPSYLPLETE